MMTHTYSVTGMTCGSCVARVKSALLKIGDVTGAQVQLEAPQATVSMSRHLSVAELGAAISAAGPYTISESGGVPPHQTEEGTGAASYKPLWLTAGFITGITLLSEVSDGSFSVMGWMQAFMAGFFLTFSFFKLLDLRGFSDSYATYDLLAQRWPAWGFIYPFVELALGVAFLTGFAPSLTNGVTFAVMGLGLAGVLKAVFRKRAIRCACLGTVFNLPMSTVTVVENGVMMAMSAGMLAWMM